MLHIRPEQMAVLAEVARRELERRAAEHLRSKGREVPEPFVRDAMARATALGFQSEEELLEVLEIESALGADFEDSQERRILGQTRFSTSARLRIIRGLREEVS